MIRSFLVSEEPFQDGRDFRYMHGSDLPNNLQIHVCIVMGHDVAHAAHFSKREIRNGLPRCISQMRRGLPDDFDAPNHRVLLLQVRAESNFRCVFNVRGNEPGGIQNVAQAAKLVSFHTSTRRWPKCARGQSGFAIFQGTAAGQNQRGDQLILPLRLPFPAVQRWRPTSTRQKLLTDLHRCQAPLPRAPQSRKSPAGECGAFRRTDATARAARWQTVLLDVSTSPKHNRSDSWLQGDEERDSEKC